jgi:hypothetical protein
MKIFTFIILFYIAYINCVTEANGSGPSLGTPTLSDNIEAAAKYSESATATKKGQTATATRNTNVNYATPLPVTYWGNQAFTNYYLRFLIFTCDVKCHGIKIYLI